MLWEAQSGLGLATTSAQFWETVSLLTSMTTRDYNLKHYTILGRRVGSLRVEPEKV